MKWVIIAPGYQPCGGGGNWAYVREFSKALIQNGVETHLITVTNKPDLMGIENLDGMKVHHIYSKDTGAGPLRPESRKKITEYALKLHATEGFDVLNPHVAFSLEYKRIPKDIRIFHTLHAVISYEYSHGCWKMITSFVLNKKNISQFLIYPIKIIVCYWLERIALQRANKIIVMSRYVKGTITRFFPKINTEKIFVSRIGVDPKFKPVSLEAKAALRRKYHIDQNQTVFFTARRLAYRMGLLNLIDAMAMLVRKYPNEKYCLLIAGKGFLMSKLQRMIQKHGLRDYVKLLGFISDEALVEYYQLSDCFVLPTEELEGFGIVSLEAMACNLAEIATPAGANPEILEKFHPELMTRNVSAEALYEKLSFFISEKSRYSSVENYDKVWRLYNWKAVVDEIKALV